MIMDYRSIDLTWLMNLRVHTKIFSLCSDINTDTTPQLKVREEQKRVSKALGQTLCWRLSRQSFVHKAVSPAIWPWQSRWIRKQQLKTQACKHQSIRAISIPYCLSYSVIMGQLCSKYLGHSLVLIISLLLEETFWSCLLICWQTVFPTQIFYNYFKRSNYGC